MTRTKRPTIVDDALTGPWVVSHAGRNATLRLKSGGVVTKKLTDGEREYLAWLAAKRTGA